MNVIEGATYLTVSMIIFEHTVDGPDIEVRKLLCYTVI